MAPTISWQQKHVRIADDDELVFWTREFGVAAGELMEAMAAVGTSARLISDYLNRAVNVAR